MDVKKTRVAVLVEQQYQEMEVWYPVYRLREAGCTVTLLGPEAGHIYPSKLNYPAKSDKSIKDVSANDFDCVVIPGGFAPDFLRRSEGVLRLVSEMAEQGKVVAAICHGPWVLCSTQALKGKKATCFFAINALGICLPRPPVAPGVKVPAFAAAMLVMLDLLPWLGLLGLVYEGIETYVVLKKFKKLESPTPNP